MKNFDKWSLLGIAGMLLSLIASMISDAASSAKTDRIIEEKVTKLLSEKKD